MSKRLVLVALAMLLGMDGSVSAATMMDDFEGYADTPELQATWDQAADWGGFGRTLDATGGEAGTQGMSLGGTNSGATGGWTKRAVAVDMSGDTAIRFWQKTTVDTNTVLDDVVYRFVIKTGGSRYYQTESYTPIGSGNAAASTALSVTGLWGGGGSGGYVDLPLAGGGDGSGADDWYWMQTQGASAAIDWSDVTRTQILGYAYDDGDGVSFSTVYDNLQSIPEPSSLLLGSFGFALGGGLWGRSKFA